MANNNNKKIKRPNINFTWFYAAIALGLIAMSLFGNDGGKFTKETNYSQLTEYITKGYVKELIVFDNNEVEAYIIPDSAEHIFNEKPSKITERPMVISRIGSVEKFEELINEQTAKGHFNGDVRYKERPQFWNGFLINILPLIFFFCCLYTQHIYTTNVNIKFSQMIIGAIKEHNKNETRCALTPEVVKKLTQLGHKIILQKNIQKLNS